MKIVLSARQKSALKISFAVIGSLLVLFLTAFWCLLAYVQAHRSRANYYNDNENYTVTRAIAHRGYSAKYFDNTAEAFEAAGKEGFFYGIETDIRLTKDGVWVCSHDDDPFEDKSVLISQTNYEDLRDLPLALGSATKADRSITYTICTFDYYLYVCKLTGKTALIEIKGERSEEEVHDAIEKAQSRLSYSRIIFAGFSLTTIERVQKADRYLNTLVFTHNALVGTCYQYMGNHLGINKKSLSKKMVERAHDKDEYIYVFTIDTRDEWEKYAEMQVDFVITNDCFA